MQTKFQRDGVQLTWQERWALRMARRQKPQWFAKMVEHWWMFLLCGIVFSVCLGINAYSIYQHNAELRAAFASETFAEESIVELSGLFLISLMQGNQAFYAFLLLALFFFVYFGIIGLVAEERKGMRRLIERYEAELAEKDAG